MYTVLPPGTSPKRKIRSQHQLSESTRERLLATKRQYSLQRQRRFSNREVEEESILDSSEQTPYQEQQRIRSANSLESLDSVSAYIQQARSNSIKPSTSAARQAIVSIKPANFKSDDDDEIHQKTFPLFRTLSSTTRTGDNSREFSAKTDDLFWSPGFSRKYVNSKKKRNSCAALEERGIEIQKLRWELSEENGKVQRLSSQLTTNAQIVSAFEQSLANMANRLTQLNHSANEKDKELQELRNTIDSIRAQNGGEIDQEKTSWSVERWKSDESFPVHLENNINKGHKFIRSKKTSWIRSSLSKAFRRSKGSASELDCTKESVKVTNHHRSLSAPILDDPIVTELQKQLQEKEKELTETRLKALNSTSQLETLRETVANLQRDLDSVRKDNDELQQILINFSIPLNNENDEIRTTCINDRTSPSILCVDCRHDDSENIKSISVKVQCRKSVVIIGTLLLAKISKHDLAREDLEAAILSVFDLYSKRLDPDEEIGLTSVDSVESYEYRGIRRSFRQTETLQQQISSSDIEKIETITVYLKGLHSLAFWTMLPLETLALFVKRWRKIRIGAVVGTVGSGKTLLAQRICQYLSKRSSKPSNISMYSATGSVHACSRYLDEVFESFSSSVDTKVILIDNLHSFEENDVEKYIFPKIRQIIETKGNDVFVLFTTNSIPVSSIPSLRVPPTMVGLLLRRRLLSMECATQSANNEMYDTIRWISDLYSNLYSASDGTLSPNLFYQSPLNNTHTVRTFIVDIWNNELITFLRSLKKEMEIDPVQYLVKTWPWKDDLPGLPRAVSPVYTNRNEDTKQQSLFDDENKIEDPLSAMLHSLRQVTLKSPEVKTKI